VSGVVKLVSIGFQKLPTTERVRAYLNMFKISEVKSAKRPSRGSGDCGFREGDDAAGCTRSPEMEPRAAIHRSAALVLLAAIVAAAASSASAIGDKCAACKAVAVSSLFASPLLRSFLEQSCCLV
jgi:hypothetical protein